MVDVLGPAALAVIRPYIDRVLGGERLEYEVDLPIAGETKPIQVISTPDWDASGNVVGWVASITDITARKDAEAKLRQMNATLEERVAERTAEVQWRANQLQRLAAQMTRAEERERRRLSQVLHDGLQQVLVAARMKTGLAGRWVQDKRAVKAIREAHDLIDQAIAESRSLTKDLSPPALYDNGLAAGLEWLARETERTYHLSVTMALAPELEPNDLSTKVFVFQSARELILNAVKHAQASSMKISLSGLGEDLLQVTIEDDGRGFCVDAMAKNYEGRGFGLFSIKERLDLIGGEFWITSSPREGTKATIVAPCRRQRHAERPADAARETRVLPPRVASTRTNRIRVLLVDDHPMFRKGLADLLMEHPDLNMVGEAANGQEALDKAIEVQPDVVLMDVAMPVMDGIEATRRIREVAPGIRVIGLSMHEHDDMAGKMRCAGASEYVTKTADVETLIEAIVSQCPRT